VEREREREGSPRERVRSNASCVSRDREADLIRMVTGQRL